MPAIPEQKRTLDPFVRARHSFTINRFTRMLTNGSDCILHNELSFSISREDDITISIDSGICVKDDVLIHITENGYQIDMSDSNYYIDSTAGLDSTGYCYVVLDYTYERTLPAPKAYYKIIKDVDTYYVPYMDDYLFLGAVKIIYSGGNYILESDPDCVYYYDPEDPLITRQVPPTDTYALDGGVIT